MSREGEGEIPVLFNSYQFLIFFPAVLLVNYALPGRWRHQQPRRARLSGYDEIDGDDHREEYQEFKGVEQHCGTTRSCGLRQIKRSLALL